MENRLLTGWRDKLTPCHQHQCRLREVDYRVRTSPEQTLQDARVAMRSDLDSEHKLTQTPAEPGLRIVSKQPQKVQSVQIEEARC